MKYKIERAYELQCSQVFTTGIVQLTNGDNIDFKRKAASMVVKEAAEYWSVDGIDPRADMKAGADFLRKIGKCTDSEFIVNLGAKALTDLLANPNVNDDKIKKTINNLTAYHKNNGYFRVEVSSKKELLKNKKGSVNYIINTGRPTFLDAIITKIKSPVLDSLYQSEKELSFLKTGDQFIEESFIKEAKRITKLFKFWYKQLY